MLKQERDEHNLLSHSWKHTAASDTRIFCRIKTSKIHPRPKVTSDKL